MNDKEQSVGNKSFPNPASDILHFNAFSKFTISDVLGRIVLQNEGLEVSIEHLPKGMYYISLGNKTAKFLKE